MFFNNKKKLKANKYSFSKFLIASFFLFNILNNSELIPRPFFNSNNDDSEFSGISFITKAVEKAGASVVTIDTERYIKQRSSSKDSRIFIDPYFERFFGLQLPYNNQPRIEQSQGSGFIFEDGLVITNAHVVNGSDKLIIGLNDGRKFEGTLIGQDFFTDLAIIKIEGRGPWPKAKLGDSKKLKLVIGQ